MRRLAAVSVVVVGLALSGISNAALGQHGGGGGGSHGGGGGVSHGGGGFSGHAAPVSRGNPGGNPGSNPGFAARSSGAPSPAMRGSAPRAFGASHVGGGYRVGGGYSAGGGYRVGSGQVHYGARTAGYQRNGTDQAGRRDPRDPRNPGRGRYRDRHGNYYGGGIGYGLPYGYPGDGYLGYGLGYGDDESYADQGIYSDSDSDSQQGYPDNGYPDNGYGQGDGTGANGYDPQSGPAYNGYDQQRYAGVARAPYTGAAAQSVPGPSPAVTLIFKDSRPTEQVHNFLLTANTLSVLDGHPHDIPVGELDLAATVRANRGAGVDFRLPPAR